MFGLQDWFFKVANWAVWISFAYLGYWMLCIFVASLWRRRHLFRQAKLWRLAGDQFLNELDKRSKPTNRNTVLTALERHIDAAWQATQHWGGGELPAVISSMVSYAARGQHDASARVLDEHLEEEGRERDLQRRYASHAQRLGLLGTVLGVAECFARGEGNTPALSSLGFALATTAVGLVIAACIELSLDHIFGPALALLALSSTGTRDQISIGIATLKLQSDRHLDKRPTSFSPRTSAPRKGANAPHAKAKDGKKRASAARDSTPKRPQGALVPAHDELMAALGAEVIVAPPWADVDVRATKASVASTRVKEASNDV